MQFPLVWVILKCKTDHCSPANNFTPAIYHIHLFNSYTMAARDLPEIYIPKARGPLAQGLRVYISGKSQAAMV